MSSLGQLVGPYERLILLKTVSLSGCPPATALGALARQAEERHFDAGVRISGSPWDSAHLVVEGRVSVYQAGQPVYSAGPKEAFGVLEALAPLETDFEARADADTLTLEIRATTLLSVLEDHHAMTQGTIQALGRTLLATPSWLVTTMV
jgi:CRP-like cAMP-binding protein